MMRITSPHTGLLKPNVAIKSQTLPSVSSNPKALHSGLPQTELTAPVKANHFGSVLAGIQFGKKESPLEASIPVMDMAEFHAAKTECAKNKFAKKFGEAFRQYGFIALKNHGVERPLINQHFKAFGDVMDRPEAELQQYSFPEFDIGYLANELKPYGKGGYTARDPKQMWHTRSNAGLFPPDAKEFATLNQQVMHDMRKVGFDIVDILGRYLGNGASDILNDYTDATHNKEGDIPQNNSLLRAIRYLKLNQDQRDDVRHIEFNGEDQVVRTGEHRDMCLFTLLPQASDSGLQLFKKEREFPKGHPEYETQMQDDKNWMDVFAQEGYLILNAGDMLDFMTRGLTDQEGHSRHIIATTHRVLGSEENLKQDRYALPFFFHGDWLKPLIELASQKPALREEAVYEGEAFDETARMAYHRLKRAGVVDKSMPYEEFVAGLKNLVERLQTQLQQDGLEEALHAGVPV